MKNCSSVKSTLNIIGGKWRPLIIYMLYENTLRFSQLQKQITGISQKMLTQELKRLEKDEIIKRVVYAQIPPKVEYSLTKKGESLIPIFQEMHKWNLNNSTI